MPVEQIAGEYNATPKTLGDGQPTMVQTTAKGYLITENSGAAPVGGGITWQAPVAVAMTGSSKTFVPANAARKALQMWSPSGNAAGAIDLAGGTVTLAGSVPISAGAAPIYIEGAATPVGIVTAIGTSTQNFYYQEGL